MQAVYFDEVKYEKNRSPFYWLGAIVAGAEQIQDLERQVNDVGRRDLRHADLSQRNGVSCCRHPERE